MKLGTANLGMLLSAGAIALSACSDDPATANFTGDGGTGGGFGTGGRVGAGGSVGTGGRVGAGGSATGGRIGAGGSGAGGLGAGGLGAGGLGAGGLGAGGLGAGGLGAGGLGAGGLGAGGLGAGGLGAGGLGAGGLGAGGAGAGGAGAGGAGAGGASPTDAGAGGTGAGGTTPIDAGAGGAGNGGSGAGGTAPVDAGAGGTGNGGTGAGGTTPVDAGSGGASPDGGDASAAQKRVFITNDRWDGDLVGVFDGGVTGLEAADLLCNAVAAAAQLGGSWVAWLSDSTTDAIDRVSDVGPWYRLDGELVFADKAALAGDPLVAINITEDLTTENFFPWTGTLADGTADADTCQDWTNGSSGLGMCGSSSSTASNGWTEASSLPCDVPYNLYCFEQ